MAHTSALTAWRPEDALLSCPRIQDPAPGPRGRCVRPLTHPAASSRPTTTGRQRDTQADRAVQVEDTTGAHAPCGRVRQSCVMGVGMPGNSRDHYLTLGTYTCTPGLGTYPVATGLHAACGGRTRALGPCAVPGRPPTLHPPPAGRLTTLSTLSLGRRAGPEYLALSDDPPPVEGLK